jgi:hypothetical protein
VLVLPAWREIPWGNSLISPASGTSRMVHGRSRRAVLTS